MLISKPAARAAADRARARFHEAYQAKGAGGDRTHAVLHEHKGEIKPLTAREAPRLLAWQAACANRLPEPTTNVSNR